MPILAVKEINSETIRENAALTIPDASYGFLFEATGRGKGMLIALVAEEYAGLDVFGSRQLDLEPLTEVEKVLATIPKRLGDDNLSEDLDKRNGSYQWSVATVLYEVE